MNFALIGQRIHDMHSQTMWNDDVQFGTNSFGIWVRFNRKDQGARPILGLAGWDELAKEGGNPIGDAIFRAFDRANVSTHERMSFMRRD
tara:strand:- start:3392 stop:3658 length:267 start_codon:yes stop_codon:yes gene_type:complete